MESAGHLGADGIGFGTTWLYDREGRIGHCVAAALPDPRIQRRHAGPATGDRG